jgi:hypothetical protein
MILKSDIKSSRIGNTGLTSLFKYCTVFMKQYKMLKFIRKVLALQNVKIYIIDNHFHSGGELILISREKDVT